MVVNAGQTLPPNILRNSSMSFKICEQIRSSLFFFPSTTFPRSSLDIVLKQRGISISNLPASLASFPSCDYFGGEARILNHDSCPQPSGFRLTIPGLGLVIISRQWPCKLCSRNTVGFMQPGTIRHVCREDEYLKSPIPFFIVIILAIHSRSIEGEQDEDSTTQAEIFESAAFQTTLQPGQQGVQKAEMRRSSGPRTTSSTPRDHSCESSMNNRPEAP